MGAWCALARSSGYRSSSADKGDTGCAAAGCAAAGNAAVTCAVTEEQQQEQVAQQMMTCSSAHNELLPFEKQFLPYGRNSDV